ncbi:MAG TPA: nucleotide exchange factor GrpE [Gemmatimonadales bacterium]|nr:nucleotide exchange factor GrpE [Gemmatimonadales bacterium]
MSKRQSEHQARNTPAEPAQKSGTSGPDAAGVPAVDDAVVTDGSAATADTVDQELRAELADLQDRHLRLAAEFDNFRKRSARERLELRARAQGEIVALMLEALDDLGRVAHLDPEQTSAGDVVAGVEMVERKLLRQLGSAGLERVGVVGEPFDPNVHEAIGTVPTDKAAADHTVAAVFQPGYRFAEQLLRPARVQVFVAGTSGAPEA